VVVASLVAGAGTVVAAIGPFDRGGGYTFLSVRPNGSPYRWDPCEPIHYLVNLENAPEGALADVHESVRRVSAATGIRFVHDGLTPRTPSQQELVGFRSPMSESGYLPVLIAWEEGDRFAALGGPAATAVGLPVTGVGADRWVYRSGEIVINAAAPMSPGFGTRASLGPTLLHEWGHVLGLGHVGDGDELMWSPEVRDADWVPQLTLTDWGEGDLAGLRLLGRDAGCIG
jgi:hypothetical protein